jgi:hypothetical protein
MPAAFTNCVKKGGKVRTIQINKKKGTYMHVCYLKGKSYPGEVKKKKSKAEFAKELVRKLLSLKDYWNDRREKSNKT